MKNPDTSHDGLRLLALADVDNLAISFRRNFGLPIDPAALLGFLGPDYHRPRATAVLTTKPGLHHTTDEWSRGGWNVVSILRERVQTIRGEEHLANADLDLAFEAGTMVQGEHAAEGFVLLTGDGTLACSIARDVRRRNPAMKIFSAAVPATASRRLQDSQLFDGFIPLGPNLGLHREHAA